MPREANRVSKAERYPTVAKFEEVAMGKAVSPSTICRLLPRHGWRKLAPVRQRPKTDSGTQHAWKEESYGT